MQQHGSMTVSEEGAEVHVASSCGILKRAIAKFLWLSTPKAAMPLSCHHILVVSRDSPEPHAAKRYGRLSQN